MRAVKSRNTTPELIVRRLAHGLGYRFRLHRKNLPGSPDIAFISRHKVVFVHGCFWHGHSCARGARVPKTNTAYWVAKIDGNRKRDRQVARRLEAMGWKRLVLWECETKHMERMTAKLIRFLQT